MNEIIYKQSPMGEIVDMDKDMGIVKGYASTFGNIDSDNDIINKGAYKKTIAENGQRIKYIYQHNMEKPLGVIKMLEEDNKGLMFEAQIAKTTLGKDVIELMKAGVLTENSVGIMPIQKEMVDGVRHINEVKLFEISAVTMAANPEAMILDVKGNINQEKILKRYDRLAKLIRKGDISDDLGYAIESEIMKLKTLFNSIITKPTEIVTEPIEVKEEKDSSEIYNYLFNRLKN
ncbi:MAG: putative prohead protease [Prokaryotic dsDNA virus sp.]|nr:MAG: putative prohead protease [Prokaryotic dsDNA virus sp.]|tara:strand:+ start:8431 stop:9126 length:696 start_codon:yes stop_codon:yes gene_type:complete